MSVTLQNCKDRTAATQTSVGAAACDELIDEYCNNPNNKYKSECACYWNDNRNHVTLSNLFHCFDDKCKQPGALKKSWMHNTNCPAAVDCVARVFIYAGGDKVSVVEGFTASQYCSVKEADDAAAKRKLELEAAERCQEGLNTCLTLVSNRSRICAQEQQAGGAESEVCKSLRTNPPNCAPCGNPQVVTLLNPGTTGSGSGTGAPGGTPEAGSALSTTDIVILSAGGFIGLLGLFGMLAGKGAGLIALMLSIIGLLVYFLAIRSASQ